MKFLSNLLYRISDKLETLAMSLDKDYESWVEAHYIEDITDEYLANPERFDIPKDFGKEKDRSCACGNLKAPESDFCKECI